MDIVGIDSRGLAVENIGRDQWTCSHSILNPDVFTNWPAYFDERYNVKGAHFTNMCFTACEIKMVVAADPDWELTITDPAIRDLLR